MDGTFTRIADGIYVRSGNKGAQVSIVRRHLQPIAAAIAPNGVVSFRSAYADGITGAGTVFINHPTRFNRMIDLPGLRISLVQGPGPLAGDIALNGHIAPRRPQDSHDILCVFELALHSPWRDTVPAFGADFPVQIAQRRALIMGERPEVSPGHFKLENIRAGNSWFVEPRFVRGTLAEGSLIASTVMQGLPRATFYAFLISEIDPFADRNGKLSRLVMNAELSRMGESRIIIPTLSHEEYVDCQRQLSTQNDPTRHVNALAQRWTYALDFSDVGRLIDTTRRTHAMQRSRSRFRLTMPDGSPLRKAVRRRN